jgi:hypothetical protein
MGVGAQLRARLHYPRERAALHIVQEAGWAQDRSGRVWGRENILPPPSFEPFHLVVAILVPEFIVVL